MTMPGMPTISLRITCKGNTLADIDALPVPVSVTPAGHIVVDPLEPVVPVSYTHLTLPTIA